MAEQEFLTHLHSLFQPRDGVLNGFREKGWKRLLEMGLPNKSHEAFRYVPLRDLYRAEFALAGTVLLDFKGAVLPGCERSHIVFVNGRFSPLQSDISSLPKQIVLLPLEDAMRSHGSFLHQHLARSLKEENDPFALLNLSLHEKGVFFYLPPQLRVEVPVQVLYLFSGNESSVSCPRLHIVLGAQSRMDCVATSFGNSGPQLFVPAIEMTLEEDAALNFICAGDVPQHSWGMQSVRASLKKKARLHALNVTFGAKAMRQSYRVALKGEEAEADLNGLWVLNDNRTAHIHAVVEHEAPSTRSMQLFKGILSGASQSSFEGKILVRKEAQKTQAYQLNRNLILSQGAVANSKPNLEIFADDVKASHGATVSQLDSEQLFYLSTRGIDEVTARHLLVNGFCREMIDAIPYDSLLKKILKQSAECSS